MNLRIIKLRLLVTLFVIELVNVRGQLTQSDKNDIIQLINVQRRSLVPSAADQLEVSWDDDLADLAQKAANTCIMEHNYDGPYYGLGENLYLGGRSPKDAFMVFYLERENYDYKNDLCQTKKYPNLNSCGHYFQNAYPGISAVGCGRAKCSGSYMFVCEFDDESGGTSPYQNGPPCSKCPPSVPFCYQGLCVDRGRVRELGVNKTQCAVKCFNCGTLRPSCSCTCPKGTSGKFCEKRVGPPISPLQCSPCQAAGLSCPKDRGIEKTTNPSQCNCQCFPGFSGTQCEVSGYNPKLNYVGCFDSASMTSNWNYNKISIESIPACNNYCSKQGFEYSALSEGNWCSCGNNFASTAVQKNENLCNSLCPSASQTNISFCGGVSGYGSVYRTLQAVQLILHAGIISSSAYPISPQQFQSQVWPILRSTVASIVNKYCADPRIACCSSADGLSVTDATRVVMVGANQPLLRLDGFTVADIEVVCNAVNVRDRRVSASRLQEALKMWYSDLKTALDTCCGVAALESFVKTVVS